METIQDVPILLRRVIEALMVAPFLDAFAKELGESRTMEIAREVIAKLARQSGAEAAKAVGGNSFEHFKMTQVNFQKGDAMDAKITIAEDDSCMHMDVTRCEYVKMYERLGLRELGGILSCERDSAFYEGFNPDVQFSRPNTIMAGDEACNFCMKKRE